MIPKPGFQDIKTIGYYIGKIIVGYGLLMLIPVFISVLLGEYNDGINFFIGFLICLITAYILLLFCRPSNELSWIQGMVIVALSWFLVMFLGAIPPFLSGHFMSWTDACFDTMSGLATVGLSLMQDLDHASYTLRMWQFILSHLGGQGMILIALTLLVRTTGVYGMYVGEGREDRVLPNIVQTARVIWGISLMYLCFWTLILWLAGIAIGLSTLEAFWQGLWLFISSWNTCGFGTQSMNLLYYHSLTFELITMAIIITGSFNFSLHYSLISGGNRKEVYRNIEIITYFITFSSIFFIVINALIQQGIYPDILSSCRKALYHVISGHGTAGNATIYSSQFLEWGQLAMLGLIMAMAIGGNSGSTCGGMKTLRIGILFKALLQDIAYLSLPKSAVMKEKFHHIKDIIMEDKIVRSAMVVIFCFMLNYALGAFVGVCFGYPFLNALFDSVSAGSGTGFTCGIVTPQMPFLLKVVYIFEMWAGRLEFMSVFALISFIISSTKLLHFGKRSMR